MVNHPYISVRKYIKVGDDPAGENTDTLVLTTAANHYVDIRINLPILPVPSGTSAMPIFPTPPYLPLSQLQWAFAGTSISTPASQVDGISKPAHTIWTHWVDSATTEEIKDEGDMHPQSNGEVLECGTMLNLEKGIVEKYEECWMDLPPVLVAPETEFKSFTFKTEWDGEGEGVRTKGMLVRIAGYIQAVLRRGDGISVGRWMWTLGQGWQMVLGIGDLIVPAEIFTGSVKLGKTLVGDDGLAWECLEEFSWSLGCKE